MSRRPAPESLTDEQSAAIAAGAGPVVIHAGAGTGKTTVIAHRTARAAADGVMDPSTALLLTFTDRAANEMAQRVAALGVPGVAAMTFHSAAWRQLRYFWPRVGGGELTILNQPWRLVSPLVRRLPGHYRFTPTADVLDCISWARTARVTAAEVAGAAEAAGRTLPVPADLMAGIMRRYQQLKDDDGLIDFDDMILRTTDLLRDRADIADQVRQRYRWFSVDEFQDTNPAQFELLREWLGERADLGVVGDEHQTIYSFAGATSTYLRSFPTFFPGARSFDLTVNHRSTPQVLALANRLLPQALRLSATRPAGPEPEIVGHPDEAAEVAHAVRRIGEWHAAGISHGEMAVLVRLNADIPDWEAAFTRADIPYQVKGTAFFARRDVTEARRLLARITSDHVTDEFEQLLTDRMGYDADEEPGTPEARERHAALTTLLDLVRQADPGPGAGGSDGDGNDGDGSGALTGPAAVVIAELDRRAEAERTRSGTGVTIATLHRAKGLEWDAVVLPGLEQGHLPVKQATKGATDLGEERRLLYVGITRARRELLLSYVQQRGGRKQQPSEFLTALGHQRANARRATRSAAAAVTAALDAGGTSLYERLKTWRLEVSRADEVPAYVVFPNSTLALIAQHRPQTHDALAAIPGVGPAKLERYGSEVLAVVAAHPGPE